MQLYRRGWLPRTHGIVRRRDVFAVASEYLAADAADLGKLSDAQCEVLVPTVFMIIVVRKWRVCSATSRARGSMADHYCKSTAVALARQDIGLGLNRRKCG